MNPQPKFYVGQPVIVKPSNYPQFDAEIVEIFKSDGEHITVEGKIYFGYSYKTNPHVTMNDAWVEEVIFPRNPDNKTNGMTWEDVKQSLGSPQKIETPKQETANHN